jgi:proteic killer suppression protein
MISSYGDKDTETLAGGNPARRFQGFTPAARRKLRMIEAAKELRDLKSPPGNRLEALKGARRGQHSIRINDQWRVCFTWKNDGAHDVEIVDYH